MTIQRIHHHTFTVSDMDRSIRFYRDLLGFKLLQDVLRENLPSYDQVMGFKDVRVRVAMFQDPAGESMLALLQFHNPSPRPRETDLRDVGTSVLAVEVADIDARYEHLSAAGVRFNTPPVDVVRDGRLAARLTYARDPDGILIELYEPARG